MEPITKSPATHDPRGTIRIGGPINAPEDRLIRAAAKNLDLLTILSEAISVRNANVEEPLVRRQRQVSDSVLP